METKTERELAAAMDRLQSTIVELVHLNREISAAIERLGQKLADFEYSYQLRASRL